MMRRRSLRKYIGTYLNACKTIINVQKLFRLGHIAEGGLSISLANRRSAKLREFILFGKILIRCTVIV